MIDEGFKRKLTAILSADVIGYSRLMCDNKDATVCDLASYQVLITQIIQQYDGRVADSPGDNIMAEFPSIVDAVIGAIKIQKEIKKRNTNKPSYSPLIKPTEGVDNAFRIQNCIKIYRKYPRLYR